ncbi:6166_t:CDS:2, partial [Paraglomus brasilianum]
EFFVDDASDTASVAAGRKGLIVATLAKKLYDLFGMQVPKDFHAKDHPRGRQKRLLLCYHLGDGYFGGMTFKINIFLLQKAVR